MPYLYYINNQKEPLKRIGVNWVRLWIERRSKSWERTSFDYDECICTVTNTVTGSTKEYLITDKTFRFPRDNAILLTDDLINNIKGELVCGR